MPGQQQLPTLSPVSRAWSEIWRLAIAVIVGAVAWAGSLALALEAGEEPLAWLVVLDVFAGLVSTVLVAFRHRAPLLIAVLTSILVGFSAASLGAWLLAVVSMATRRRLPDIGVAFAATVAGQRDIGFTENDGLVGSLRGSAHQVDPAPQAHH